YRKLQRLGVPFAVGVLQENDRDLPVARLLASRVIIERAYEPVSDERLAEAREVLGQCEKVICCTPAFGTENRGNERLAAYAREQGLLLEEDPLTALDSLL
ncbi:MAG: ABC transporter ATP-binding protein, partial [Oscillospiraceae bacterium]|nr:ABC transporter ATP-binding protein [Oscillospiraceae bacterium]